MREPNPDFWRRRRVFVTGATGLLGSHLVRGLLDLGAEVVALVRDAVPRSLLVSSGLLERIVAVPGSVTDEALLRRIVVDYEIQTTFHLAAQTLVTHAYTNPIETFDTNVGGTVRLLEACRVYGSCTEVIVAASDKAYGQQKALPYTEASPMQGSYPYDASKSCADIVARCYATTYGLPTAVTRLANLFGPGDLNFDRLIPGTIRSVLLGEPVIVRSDGTPRREYIFVGDGARAYLLLAEDVQNRNLSGQAFNVGLGYPLTVLEVVEAVKQAAGRPEVPVEVLGQAKAEIDAQWMDSTKVRKELNWEPKWSFQAGLEQTIPWYADYVGDA